MEKYFTAGQATDDNMAHAHCILYTEGYIHTLRLCNTYCISTASMVARTRLCVTLYVHCLYCVTKVGVYSAVRTQYLHIQFGIASVFKGPHCKLRECPPRGYVTRWSGRISPTFRRRALRLSSGQRKKKKFNWSFKSNPYSPRHC